MAGLRVGIHGFGRGGRNVFRALWDHDAVDVVAVVDPGPADALRYLLRFDTFLGRFPEEVGGDDGELVIGERRIAFRTGEEARADWGDLGVDVVVETRIRTEHSRESMEAQLAAGADALILCVPPDGEPDATVVMGINDEELRPEHRIVSNASGTAHCVAPVLRILDRAFGIERAYLNIVHAYTEEQRLADVPARDPRSGRAAAENIIPQSTNAAAVLGKILPEIDEKLSAQALNVPVHNGSLVDLVCWHREPVSVAAVNEAVRGAADSDEFRDILYYEDDPIVSTDILGTSYSSIFDSDATMVLGEGMSKTISWFDNGWAYALRVGDLLERIGELRGGSQEAGS